jgi:hypothetical protein
MAKLGTFVDGTVPVAADLNAGAAAWATWSPTYANLTIGNGTVIAKYAFFGRTVFFKWKLTWGSTTSCGAAPTVSLPVTAADAADIDRMGTTLGLVDVSTGKTYLGVSIASTTLIQLEVVDVSGTYAADAGLSSTLPVTWTTGDIWRMSGTYEATS